MRWIFGALLALNIVFFLVGFIVVGTHSDVEFVAPAPISNGVNPSILLLSELPNAYLSRGVENSSVEQGSDNEYTPIGYEKASVTEAKPVCIKLGPFSGVKQADLAAMKIALPEQDVKVEETPEKIVHQYWVYIPPIADRSSAIDMLRKLHAAGVDSFVVSEGEEINAISLGTFSKIELAEALKESLVSNGYPAAVMQKDKVRSSAWVYLRASLKYSQQDNFLSEFGNLSRSTTACEIFAL